MRKLVWFAVGFAAACAVGVYLVSGMWLLLLSFCALTCVAVAACFKGKRGRAVLLLFCGAAVSFIWVYAFDGLYLSLARSYDAQVVEASVEATDYSYETDYGIAVDGKILLEDKTYRIRCYLYEDTALAPGDCVEGSIRLRYTAFGGADEATHHSGKGIFLLGYFKKDVQISRTEEIPAVYFAARLRQQIKNLLDELFPSDTVAFARALLLGDSSLLSYRDSTDLSVSGIRHIIAVSGLHVSILFSMVFVFFGYHRVLTPLIGLPLLFVFAALAGFTPSVVRACIMQGLMLLALMADKEYDAPTALAFAALVMLTVNPLTITSVSFQLSAGCMVGILSFSGKIRGYFMDEKRFGPAKGRSWKDRLTRWVVGSVSVTLSAMVVTTPLCAWYFGMVSLVGILTNLLTLWVVTFLFCGIMAACIVGAIWFPVGQGIAWVISWIARYVLLVSRILASFPLAAVYTQSIYIVLWLVFCYVLLAVFLRTDHKKPVVLGCCMAASLCAAVGLSWLEPKLDDYRMTVLDVGQGQCILLQTDDSCYMVDCGGDSFAQPADVAAQTLLSQGITHLDGLILTHYDKDHAGGVMDLLTRIPADRLYLPDIEDSGNNRDAIALAYEDSICWIHTGAVNALEDIPISLFCGEDGSSDNESSLCVLFQPENCDILITGDRSIAGERALLAQTDLPDLEVLVVGHHGSKNSTGIELLNATHPELAVISVGEGNSYGHPAEDVLIRLQRYGCAVLRTDEIGDIIIRG